MNLSAGLALDSLYMISGGVDSQLIIWKDTTIEKQDLERQSEHQQQIQQDNYQSLMRAGEFISAARLSFQENFMSSFIAAMEACFRKIDFRNELIYTSSNEPLQVKQHGGKVVSDLELQIQQLIEELCQKDINKTLNCVANMNSTQKFYRIGQRFLQYLLSSTSLGHFEHIAKNF